MTSVKFDGCTAGVKTSDGIPMKKPWTIKTNTHCLHNFLDGRICSCTVEHAEGRGRSLKNTESGYTYVMTDLIHTAFAYAVSVQEKVASALIRKYAVNAVWRETVEEELRQWDIGYKADLVKAGLLAASQIGKVKRKCGPSNVSSVTSRL